MVDPKEIEHSIEKKRARVTMEAIHRAEKAKQQTGMFNVGNLTRKGGIPNNKLRGITDADFFQKNNTVEKGWTFNYDGTLVDFKKPKLLKELDEKAQYEIGKEVIKSEPNKKGGHKTKNSG